MACRPIQVLQNHMQMASDTTDIPLKSTYGKIIALTFKSLVEMFTRMRLLYSFKVC